MRRFAAVPDVISAALLAVASSLSSRQRYLTCRQLLLSIMFPSLTGSESQTQTLAPATSALTRIVEAAPAEAAARLRNAGGDMVLDRCFDFEDMSDELLESTLELLVAVTDTPEGRHLLEHAAPAEQLVDLIDACCAPHHLDHWTFFQACQLWERLPPTRRFGRGSHRKKLALAAVSAIKFVRNHPAARHDAEAKRTERDIVSNACFLLQTVGPEAFVKHWLAGTMDMAYRIFFNYYNDDEVTQCVVSILSEVVTVDNGEHAFKATQCGLAIAVQRALELGYGLVSEETRIKTIRLLRLLAARPDCSLVLRIRGVGGVDAIFRHADDSATMAAASIHTLAAFAAHPHHRLQYLAGAAVPRLLALADPHAGKPAVCEAACRAIANLALSRWSKAEAAGGGAGAGAVAARSVELQAAELILQMSQLHSKSMRITMGACAALTNLLLTAPAGLLSQLIERMGKLARKTAAAFADEAHALASAFGLLCLVEHERPEPTAVPLGSAAGTLYALSGVAAIDSARGQLRAVHGDRKIEEVAGVIVVAATRVHDAALLHAAARGDAAAMTAAFRDAPEEDLSWAQAVVLAADGGHLACIDALRHMPADWTHKAACTALCAAVVRGNVDVAEHLLAAWRACTISDFFAPFWLAAERWDVDMLRLLADHRRKQLLSKRRCGDEVAWRRQAGPINLHESSEELARLETLLSTPARDSAWCGSEPAGARSTGSAGSDGASPSASSQAANDCFELRQRVEATAVLMLVDAHVNQRAAGAAALARAAAAGHSTILAALLANHRVDAQTYTARCIADYRGPSRLPAASLKLLLCRPSLLRTILRPAMGDDSETSNTVLSPSAQLEGEGDDAASFDSGSDAPEPESAAAAAVVPLWRRAVSAIDVSSLCAAAWRRRQAAVLARAVALGE